MFCESGLGGGWGWRGDGVKCVRPHPTCWRGGHGGRGMERHGERNIMRESVTAQPAGVLTCINNMPAFKLSTRATHLEKYACI